MSSETSDVVGSRLLESLRAVLREQPNLELALLFGSRARGEARDDRTSDLDIAVEGEDLDLLELGRKLSEATDLEVDILDLRTAGYPLLQALLRDSLVLHEGRPHAEARFRTRAILQTETDRPWYERMRDAYLEHLSERRGG